jgi:hypothetical protein
LVGSSSSSRSGSLASARHSAARRRSPPLASRLARQVDAELVGDRFHLMRGGRIRAGKREIQQRIEAGEERVLFQRDDARAGLDRAAAASASMLVPR